MTKFRRGTDENKCPLSQIANTIFNKLPKPLNTPINKSDISVNWVPNKWQIPHHILTLIKTHIAPQFSVISNQIRSLCIQFTTYLNRIHRRSMVMGCVRARIPSPLVSLCSNCGDFVYARPPLGAHKRVN